MVIPYVIYQLRHWHFYRNNKLTHHKLTGYLAMSTQRYFSKIYESTRQSKDRNHGKIGYAQKIADLHRQLDMKNKVFIIILIIIALAIIGRFAFKKIGKQQVINSPSGQLNPDSSQSFSTLYNLATQFRLNDKTDSSIIYYEKATRLKPEDKDALYYLGDMYRKEREFVKARLTWEKLIKLDSLNERTFIQLGNLYFCMTHRKYFDPEQAKFYFQQAKALNKDSIQPNLSLGEIAIFQDKTKEALSIFNQLSTIDENNVEVNYLNGYLYWKSGNNPQALNYLKRSFLASKNDSINDATIADNRQCNLFLYYTTANVNQANQINLNTSMPEIYKEFDQYLVLMRDQLNHT